MLAYMTFPPQHRTKLRSTDEMDKRFFMTEMTIAEIAYVHSYMGLRESSSGFEARLTFFLPSSLFLFALRSTVSSSRPTCQTAGARRVGQGDPHLRAREGLFVLDGRRDLERVGATTYNESRDRPLYQAAEKDR